MKHILNNANQGEVAPWVVLNEDGVHYGGNVVIEEDSYEYVDLDLPSGLLWATCNIGASKPEEYGLYFQWGATQGYTGDDALAHSTWSTAPFNNGSSSYDSTYFASVKDEVCPNGVLAPQYDAAFQATNGAAHMPTTADIDELIANTTSNWYVQGNTEFNGVAGIKFVSKIDASKYIFIPAAGFCSNSSFKSTGNGGVWSSSLDNSDNSRAYRLGFSSDRIGNYGSEHDRGFSVRGVKNPS